MKSSFNTSVLHQLFPVTSSSNLLSQSSVHRLRIQVMNDQRRRTNFDILKFAVCITCTNNGFIIRSLLRRKPARKAFKLTVWAAVSKYMHYFADKRVNRLFLCL